MWWLAIAAGCYYFRGKIAEIAGRYVSRDKLTFFGHCACVFGSLLFIIPFEMLGFGVIKNLAWMAALWGHGAASMTMVAKNDPLPDFPTNLDFKNWKQSLTDVGVKIQPWLQNVLTRVDFHYLFFVLIFLAASPTVVVVALVGRRSFWVLCTDWEKTNSSNMIWSLVKPRWEALQAAGRKAIVEKCNLFEIGYGIWLVISLFLPTRQIFACILYWHFLKIRYQAGKHKDAWLFFDQTFAQKAVKAVPLLQKPLGMAKGWFQPQVQYQYRPQ